MASAGRRALKAAAVSSAVLWGTGVEPGADRAAAGAGHRELTPARSGHEEHRLQVVLDVVGLDLDRGNRLGLGERDRQVAVGRYVARGDQAVGAVQVDDVRAGGDGIDGRGQHDLDGLVGRQHPRLEAPGLLEPDQQTYGPKLAQADPGAILVGEEQAARAVLAGWHAHAAAHHPDARATRRGVADVVLADGECGRPRTVDAAPVDEGVPGGLVEVHLVHGGVS